VRGTFGDVQRILLADDHPEFLGVVARHLQPHFDVVRAVGNGQAMLDEAARLDPDVVVLDISMPVLNGIEAARKLRATGSRAKIVFLTVHADQDYVRAAIGAGAVGYVLKSELASDLLTCLRHAEAAPFVSPAISWES
jgi:DNA-binding NarL/FixJ family response regulator